MKNSFGLSFFFSLLLFITVYPQNKISAIDAKNHIGENETVIGIDSQVYHSRGGACFLDIDGNYPDNTFAAVIFKSDLKKFKDIDEYEGKEIEVTGKIKEYNGKPEIILKSESQIEIIRKGN
jgi:micrococcal nuclease